VVDEISVLLAKSTMAFHGFPIIYVHLSGVMHILSAFPSMITGLQFSYLSTWLGPAFQSPQWLHLDAPTVRTESEDFSFILLVQMKID